MVQVLNTIYELIFSEHSLWILWRNWCEIENIYDSNRTKHQEISPQENRKQEKGRKVIVSIKLKSQFFLKKNKFFLSASKIHKSYSQ